MKVIVDVQGFKIDHNQFILKEICILYNDQIHLLLIQPPFPFHKLSVTEKKQVKWIEKNRKIYWNDGFIPYSNYSMYINEILIDKIIFCKGTEKMVWIKNMLQRAEVYNLEDMQCPKLLSLYEKYKHSTDVSSCIYHPTICALRNVTCLRKWCLDNKVL